MDDASLNQVEDEEISHSLDVEKLDVNLFRSKNLWVPKHARGVFGGQVISQAVVAATTCVNDPSFGLHSLHCYFVLSASPSVPIHYHVDRVREGRSYVTRAVRAIQNGRVVFILLCSFQKSEPWQPTYRPSMPGNVMAPDSCEDEDVTYRKMAKTATIPKLKDWYLEKAEARATSPIAVRRVREGWEGEDFVSMIWIRAKNMPKEKRDVAYQKCVLGYMSDIHFIGTASRAMGLKNGEKNGRDILGLISTLDHAIWFYDDNFDCADWLLYEMRAAQAASGRGLVLGRMFSQDGRLIANLSQEGVVRARVRGPEEPVKEKSKL